MAKKEKKAKDPNKKSLWKEFKAFISRGNVLDMAVGVIIGGAFSAIVTAVVNILMSVCTWGIPGGIKGLVTVLPALTEAQKGMNATIGLGQKFAAGDLQTLATNLANATYGEANVSENLNLIESAKTTILGKYTLHGTTYTYNMSATIDWGTLINAVISFLIIAVTLFIIVKIAASITKARKDFEAKAREEFYQKHPEKRPAPVVPGVPAPTTNELLGEILNELKANKKE